MRLPADLNAPSHARAAVSSIVSGVLDDERLEVLRLGVSEVVTNAVQHGSSPDQTIDIALQIRTDAIRVTVTQSEPAFDRPDRAAPSASGVGGYGLPILEAVSDRWDVDPGPPPFVWFEMDFRAAT
jgi:anti-sigma regulatory factor (Ser/Thr protein kinase)